MWKARERQNEIRKQVAADKKALENMEAAREAKLKEQAVTKREISMEYKKAMGA